jgi:hypothetical protein
MEAGSLSDDRLLEVLQRYLSILQGHPSAEAMMDSILTEDFETGFVGGHVWCGPDGLRDFLSQREGFFDEEHVIDELIERGDDCRSHPANPQRVTGRPIAGAPTDLPSSHVEALEAAGLSA